MQNNVLLNASKEDDPYDKRDKKYLILQSSDNTLYEMMLDIFASTILEMKVFYKLETEN